MIELKEKVLALAWIQSILSRKHARKYEGCLNLKGGAMGSETTNKLRRKLRITFEVHRQLKDGDTSTRIKLCSIIYRYRILIFAFCLYNGYGEGDRLPPPPNACRPGKWKDVEIN